MKVDKSDLEIDATVSFPLSTDNMYQFANGISSLIIQLLQQAAET